MTMRAWSYPQPYGTKALLIVICVLAVLFHSAERVEVGQMFAQTSQSLLGTRTSASEGLSAVARRLMRLQISDRQEVARIPDFHADRLPPFAYLENVRTIEQTLDPSTLKLTRKSVPMTYLVRPFGYVEFVVLKILETLEIAFWGTLIGTLIALPLSLLTAKNITPSISVRFAARGLMSLLRSVPELVSALLLVIAYGFGPIAGFLSLGMHGAGVLGKFYADDMENADPQPQEALAAIGAGRIAIWRLAVLPQVMPQHVGATLYVLDRNVRMATVIGLVGAGGIGQELKGRYDMYNYGHVGTILLVIFITVLALDQLSGRLRRRFL